MPIMDGLEATDRIAKASSIPVLVFTHNDDPELPFKALERGAVDFLHKPDFNDLNRPDYITGFIARLRALSTRRTARPSACAEEHRPEAPAQTTFAPALPQASMIVVGASTGGPQAVSRFLSCLRSPFPLPIALVQHIETGFDQGYADWLSDDTGHHVVLAREGEKPLPGTVYVARTDYHLLVSPEGFDPSTMGKRS